MSIYAAFVGASVAGQKEIAHIAVVGVTLQCLYLGAMFSALGEGVSQGVAALVAGMQPLLTAAVVGLTLGERVSRIQWAGLYLGLPGCSLSCRNDWGLAQQPLPASFFRA